MCTVPIENDRVSGLDFRGSIGLDLNRGGRRYNPRLTSAIQNGGKTMRKFILAAALTVVSVTASAATVAGVNIADTAQIGDKKVVLNGAALRKKFVVKVYVGALYLPSKQNNAAAILAADAPRRQV